MNAAAALPNTINEMTITVARFGRGFQPNNKTFTPISSKTPSIYKDTKNQAFKRPTFFDPSGFSLCQLFVYKATVLTNPLYRLLVLRRSKLNR